MPTPLIVRDGEIVRLRSYDPVFMYGYGIFETIKLHNRQLCFWQEHWARMMRSAEVLGLASGYSEDGVLSAISQLADDDSLSNCAIKLSLVLLDSDVRLYVYAREFSSSLESVRICSSATNPLNQSSLLAAHKTNNYMENYFLLRQCQKRGYFDALRWNTDGFLAETTKANVFCIRDKVLCTPALAVGVLPGVVRANVLKVAQEIGVRCEEGLYGRGLIENSSAVFLTNSLQGLVPVESIHDDCVYTFDSAADPLHQKLLAGFLEAELSTALEI